MIITKTPFRMSFFGGGTDMEEYFRKNEGAVLSTTFDKYCYVNVRHLPRFFDYSTELSYSKTERVTNINDIQHPAIREAMKMLDMREIRLTYEADLPARSGLVTSSSFAVGMLNAFYALKGKYADKKKLADEAIYLERVLCNESGGWQDQIAASFGGFNRINFNSDGYEVLPVIISPERKRMLNDNLLMFFTGFTRFSSDVQKANNIGVEEDESEAARREWERYYLRLRISGETGVEIREEEGIYELFSETLGELYNEFSDIYYFDPQFDMSKKSDIAMAEEEQVLFSIRSNAVKTAVVEVVANMTFDSDMDGDSLLYISCRRDGTEIFRTVLEYHNGSGMEDTFEGKIVLNSESYYDTEELDEFKDELKDYIEEKLNPLISKKESLEYTAATSGGAEPVADIPCMECGKYGISISEDFYPLGRCCYCGEENYIKQCQRCGKWYEDGDGNDTVCAECLEKVMEE